MNSTVVLFVPFFSLLWCFSIEAQHLKTVVDFSQYTEEYKELEEASLLTSANQAWGERQWILQLEPTIYFPGTEDRPFNQFGVSTLGQIALWHNTSHDNIELDLYLVPFALNVVSPLQDHLNEDQGEILYMMEDDFIKVEFRNVALAVEKVIGNGNLTSRVNYSVEIDPANDRVRLHYGPSQISSSLQSHISINGILVGVAFEAWQNTGQQFFRIENLWHYLKGSAEDFDLGMHEVLIPASPLPAFFSFPPEGTVYEFSFSELPTSITEPIMDQPFVIFPNPGTDQFQLELQEWGWTNADIEVLDMMGRIVLKTKVNGDKLINSSAWSSGIYTVRISSKDETFSHKWIKQ